MAQPVCTLDYSTDGGNTFTGAPLAFTFQRARVYAMSYFTENPVSVNQRKTQVPSSYLRAELETTWLETSPDFAATAAAANAAWLFLQNWVKAPIKRIAWDTTKYATAGSYSQWNSGTNTNYVNIVEYEPSFMPSDWATTLAQPKNRWFRMIVEMRDAL